MTTLPWRPIPKVEKKNEEKSGPSVMATQTGGSGCGVRSWGRGRGEVRYGFVDERGGGRRTDATVPPVRMGNDNLVFVCVRPSSKWKRGFFKRKDAHARAAHDWWQNGRHAARPVGIAPGSGRDRPVGSVPGRDLEEWNAQVQVGPDRHRPHQPLGEIWNLCVLQGRVSQFACRGERQKVQLVVQGPGPSRHF